MSTPEPSNIPAGMEFNSTPYGGFFYWSNDLYIAESFRKHQVYEQEEILGCLQNIVKRAKTILDIGAHVGSHCITYIKLNPDVKIYAFEAQSQVFDCLERNIKWNQLSNIFYEHCAIGHRNGTARLSCHPTDGPNVNHLISYGGTQACNLGGIQLGNDGETISMRTIDSLQLTGCDYIKIDVEGFEPFVLLGAVQTISKFHPTIMFEKNHKIVTQDMIDYFQFTPQQASLTSDKILLSYGYDIYPIMGGNFLAIYHGR